MKKMRLYFLRKKFFDQHGHTIQTPKYDTMNALVVRANSPEQARTFAAQCPGDEGGDTWLDKNLSDCKFLPQDGMNGVIIRDFNAG